MIQVVVLDIVVKKKAQDITIKIINVFPVYSHVRIVLQKLTVFPVATKLLKGKVWD